MIIRNAGTKAGTLLNYVGTQSDDTRPGGSNTILIEVNTSIPPAQKTITQFKKLSRVMCIKVSAFLVLAPSKLLTYIALVFLHLQLSFVPSKLGLAASLSGRRG
jgi:hypothetical protein